MADKIRQGRREFLKKELHLEDKDLERMPDPLSPETFLQSHLDWNELTKPDHANWLEWYRRILTVRREQIAPLLGGGCNRCGSYQIHSPGAFTARWTLDRNAQLALDANLCDRANECFARPEGATLWIEGEADTPARLTPWTVRLTLHT
jgi:1,4-alpha-glucan branching enzyme